MYVFVHLFDLYLFCFVCGLCPLPLGVWEGLRFVIVALPGLFSHRFFFFVFFFFTIVSNLFLIYTLKLLLFRPLNINPSPAVPGYTLPLQTVKIQIS